MDASNHNKDYLQSRIEKLKEKYSQELKNDPENPLKVCMKLVFESATEKDAGTRLEISNKLSQFLTKSDGLITLVLALIDFDASSQKTTTHNQRFHAVAKIITHLPKLCMPYEEYCENIASQLRPLLISENLVYSNLACIVIKSMIESPHADSKNISALILSPYLESLFKPKTEVKPSDAITAIHNLILCHLPIDLFIKVFPHLFYALAILIHTPSRQKALLKISLANILSALEPGPACCLIENTLFHNSEVYYSLTTSAEDEGISIKVTSLSDVSASRSTENFKSLEKLTTWLLENANNELLTLEFFFHFNETMWSANDERCRTLSASLIEPLLSQTLEEKSAKLDLFSLIATNTDRVLELLTRILLNYLAFLQNHDCCETRQHLINQSIGSCLKILEVLLMTSMNESDRDLLLQKCFPVLTEIQTLISSREGIGFRDDLNLLLMKFGEASQKESSITHNKKFREYNSIIKDLNDKLIPVRVHALVKLRQMLLANDRYIVDQIPQTYSLVEAFLADEEPYVFLACINLLTAMVIRNTKEILPKLVPLYLQKELDLQQRINVGEVLVRMTKQLNQTTPFYARQVMNMLLQGCKDEEEIIRMSCLTNIGQLCQNLGYSLGNYITEILNCIESILLHDSIQVKCAALDLLRTTLMGLDKYNFESIQVELKTIYSLLKKLERQTLDDNFCLQVGLALEEIDRLVRELAGFDIERTIVKNIKVLSLLDDR